MLGLGASSGYEIKQMVELSIRFFWTISQAQIYPALAQLEEAELVVGRSEPRGRRPRRVYSLTAAGEEELRTWLRRAEPMPFVQAYVSRTPEIIEVAQACIAEATASSVSWSY